LHQRLHLEIFIEIQGQQLGQYDLAVGWHRLFAYLWARHRSDKTVEHAGAELALCLFPLTLNGNTGQPALKRIREKSDHQHSGRSHQLGEDLQPL